ncbi:MAG: hypothetical protein U0175_39465 [Caldilineaceae bacterium]
MFYSPKASIDTFLIHGNHILTYLEGQAEAQTLLARYGLDGSRLQEGRSLLAQVQNDHWAMRNQRRQQKVSTINLHAEWAQARRLYRRHRQAAREVLNSDVSLLLRPGPKNYAEWLAGAQEFYAAMLSHSDYQAALATVDITPEQLLHASQLISTMTQQKNAQAQNREAARTAKVRRDQLLSEAKAWFAVLMATAQVAFRQQPGMLEAIRILPDRLSAEEKTQKQSKAKAAKTPQAVAASPAATLL